MRELRRERDLVFIDQRGTGDSNRLGCSIINDRESLQNYFLEVFPAEACTVPADASWKATPM